MKMTRIGQFKKSGRKLVMMTAYDAPTAELLESQGVDMILVGDSLGMVLLGYESTVDVSMDEMIHHTKAVRRGAKNSFVVGDLPLKGVRSGPAQTLRSAQRFMKEGGCQAVKLEWSKHCLASTKLLVAKGIPVMGHIGLTPQTAAKTGGFKVRGNDARKAFELIRQALAFQEAGVFALLLECVPSAVTREIRGRLRIPVFGIGAGPDCDGQVLVFHDVVGAFKKFKPRFVKSYADLHEQALRAVRRFSQDVRGKRFPGKEHGFSIETGELNKLRQLLKSGGSLR